VRRSTDRILTTHVGSLIRPDDLVDYIRPLQAGEPYDEAGYLSCLADSANTITREQSDHGIDVVSDGEYGKSISWSQYVLKRLSGFERKPLVGENPFKAGADREKFGAFYEQLDGDQILAIVMESVCTGPIEYTGQDELERDIANFKAALAKVNVTEGFLPVAAPASVIPDRRNEYYDSDDDCLDTIGAAMAVEYNAVVDSGLLVQWDDARTAVTFDRRYFQRL